MDQAIPSVVNKQGSKRMPDGPSKEMGKQVVGQPKVQSESTNSKSF